MLKNSSFSARVSRIAVDSCASAAPANFRIGASARSGAKHVIRVGRPLLCQEQTLRRKQVLRAPEAYQFRPAGQSKRRAHLQRGAELGRVSCPAFPSSAGPVRSAVETDTPPPR